jgi:hypothetical protein
MIQAIRRCLEITSVCGFIAGLVIYMASYFGTIMDGIPVSR